MAQKTSGMLFACMSAVLYGVSAVITKQVTLAGCSVATLLCVRGGAGALLLAGALLCMRRPFRLPLHAAGQVLLLALAGSTATLFFLNQAYRFLSVGSVTTLHYLYPAAVNLTVALRSRTRPPISSLVALAACTIGVALLFDACGPGQLPGVLFAALSVASWTFQMTYLAFSRLSRQDPLALAFWQCCVLCLTGLIGGFAVGGHTFAVVPGQWIRFLLVALFNNVLASVLLQLGIARIGAGLAAILSVFEPISSLLFGFWLLNERLAIRQWTACGIILTAVTALLWVNRTKQERSATR